MLWRLAAEVKTARTGSAPNSVLKLLLPMLDEGTGCRRFVAGLPFSAPTLFSASTCIKARVIHCRSALNRVVPPRLAIVLLLHDLVGACHLGVCDGLLTTRIYERPRTRTEQAGRRVNSQREKTDRISDEFKAPHQGQNLGGSRRGAGKGGEKSGASPRSSCEIRASRSFEKQASSKGH